MAATAEETGTGFDLNKATKEMDKYSRQVGAYGVAVMRFLRKLRVLIVGSKGVGIEAAKNLVLTGCRAVHLHDEGLVELADLGTNFFLRPEHVGQPRAASLVAAVQELNEDVQVEAVSGDVLALLQSGKYRAVIVTDNSVALSQLAAWDEWCRAHSVAFTVALASGVLGFLFADFGPGHVCSDANGELHKYVAIQKIERNEAGKFLLTLDDAHDLDDGDHLQVEDVKGIDNFEGQVFEIRRVYSAGGTLLANQLVLDKLVPPKDPVTGERSPPVEVDFRTWGTYEKGGFIREVKKETVFQHLPLTEALHKAPILFPEVMKSFSGGPSRGLLAQVALWSFVAAHGQLPRLHNAEDATALHTLAKEAHSSFSACGASNVADLDASELAKVALYARTEISGLCAFLGGVVAQEVVKKSSKWTPISQFLIHELYDLVSEQPPADAAPQGSRYDHQIALFGSAFQDSLLADKWFLVGCGALGCEYMKSFALMGVGCGAEGLLSATDMDTIEVSNLARQFLFRREHVGKMKSLCAAAAAKKMNPDINIRIYTDPVGPKTENIFNETFWLSLTGVVNALDNVQARLYVDSRCVLFRRPLLESGTLGTLANTEVIVPHKTASYGENHVETKQRYVPQCTFKNFPYLIEHTIGWAGKTGEFATLFVEPANDLKSAIAGLEQFWKNLARVSKESKKVERLRPVVELLPKLHHLNFETCVQLAFQRLISQYRDRILSLTHYCPRDMLKTDRDSGQTVPFWSAPKRFPTALSWDPANPDPAHVEYIYNTANLYAHMFHLDPRRDEAPGRPDFARYLVELQLTAPEWTPGDKSSLGEVEEETEAAPAEGGAAAEGKEDEVERDRRLLAEFTEAINSFDWEPLRAQQAALRAVDAKDSLIRPAEFEKDDDTNFHIDFVTSASNLRARNYDIPAADRHKTKMTAGNIIPAIATTTAMITGLNSIEFLKLKLGLTIDKMRNSNVNLGVSDFQLFEPGPPKQAQADYDPIEMEVIDPLPPAFTVWDTIHINRGDITLERLLADFPSIHLGAVPTNIVRQEIHYDKKEDKKEEEKEDTPTKLIYSDSPLFTSRIAGYMPRLITDIWQQEYGPLPDSSFLPLTVSAQLNGRPVKIPPVLYQYK